MMFTRAFLLFAVFSWTHFAWAQLSELQTPENKSIAPGGRYVTIDVMGEHRLINFRVMNVSVEKDQVVLELDNPDVVDELLPEEMRLRAYLPVASDQVDEIAKLLKEEGKTTISYEHGSETDYCKERHTSNLSFVCFSHNPQNGLGKSVDTLLANLSNSHISPPVLITRDLK